jgi:hypothetical protein
MHEMMDFQLVKERREEVLREVELDRLAQRVRATCKRRDSWRSALVWEMRRYAEGLLKFLRALRNAR